MRAQGLIVGSVGLALCLLACGPRSNDVDRFEALDDDGQLTGSGGGTSVGATSGAGASDGSGAGSGSSLHSGAGGGSTTSSGSGASGPSTTSTGSGGNTDGPCCSPSGNPGCTDSSLETCVCATDSYCCNNQWDAICVWHAQDSCQACTNAPCTDIAAAGEPNDSEANAFQLTSQPITDCNSAGGSFWGTINGASDADWYTYEGSDTFACVVDPSRTVTSLEAPVRICKYFQCNSGQANVSCPSGTTADTSPGGRPGCCGSDGFSVDLDCSGTSSDDAHVYVRIDQPGAPQGTCNHYSATYHY